MFNDSCNFRAENSTTGRLLLQGSYELRNGADRFDHAEWPIFGFSLGDMFDLDTMCVRGEIAAYAGKSL